MTRLGAVMITAMLATAAGIGGCGDDGGGGSKDTGPIKVGAVASLTGPFVLNESTAAAKAVFDEVNADGGIDGRKIEYVVEDDKGQPQAAAQAARALVDDGGVVANVGSASILECAVNAKFYAQRKLLSVQGGSADPVCFNSPNISPVDAGLFTSIGLMLQYAAKDLHKTRICAILHNQPGFAPAYAAVLDAFQQRSGLKLAYVDKNLGASADPTPAVLNAKRAGCQAVVFTGIGPQVVALMKAVQAQGLQKDIAWLALASAYGTDMPKALGSAGEGMYANSQFELLDADVPAVSKWAALMREHDVPISSFSQGGYLAAEVFVKALRSIKGPITRESVTKALHRIDAYRSPLIGTPYSFAPADRHASNVGSRIVQLRNGEWVPVEDGFYTLEG